MRDLIRLSEEELHELTTPQRLRIFAAIGISLACGIISLQGMAAVFTDATVVPLPGMQHLVGQIAWAAGLVVMLIGVTFLLRGVIKRRLQWAIALSLLIHLLLCLSMTSVDFRGPQSEPDQAADASDVPRDEFTLPDYAGMELPSPDKPWEKTSDSETPEKMLEHERTEQQIADSQRPETANTVQPQQAEVLPTPERQERVEMSAEAAAELERQMAESAAPAATAVEQPSTSTAAAEAAKLEARVAQQKLSSEIAMAERQLDEPVTPAHQTKAAQLEAARTESSAALRAMSAAENSRSVTEVQATSAAAESVDVQTTAADQAELQEQNLNVARQTATAANETSQMAAAAPSAVDSQAIAKSAASRAEAASDASQSTPENGGAVSISRQAATSVSAVGDSSSEDAAVSTADGSDAPQISESALATAGSRGAKTNLPANSAASGLSPADSGVPGGSPASGTIATTKIARAAGGNARPNPGESGGQPLARSTSPGTGRQAAAVGSTVKPSGLAAAGQSGKVGSPAVLAGPATASVGRQATGLPSTATSASPGTANVGTSSAGAPATAALSATANRASVAMAGSIRGTDPSARLDRAEGVPSGSSSRLPMARSETGGASGLPTGMLAAEQSGTLVIAGPQSAGAGKALVAGPAVSSLPRRSAGLPGAGGTAGAPAAAPGSGSLPLKVAATAGRGEAGAAAPKLASADFIGGLVKRSVQARGGSAEARIPESLSMRTTTARREAARTLGGSEPSEEAVERGLEWLTRNQYPDGHWSINDFPGEDEPNLGQGSFQSDSAATGLALLAYLGAGYTHQSGKYQETVGQGMKWLLDRQKANGDLFSDETEFVWFYSHGIASIAVCEAYGLTKDAALKEPAQKALDFIVASQHPKFGGWRYRPQFESDTSVSGWQLMALKSGEMAGLNVPASAYANVAKWLDSVESKTAVGQFSYHPSSPPGLAMTAEGLLMRQYLGAKRDDPQLIAGANFLRTRLPDFGQRDSYYWYYATQVMFHMQGEYWNEWNAGLRDLLTSTQSKTGPMSGSWDPARPTPEKWANGGGRHYLTCVNLLMLEVYYRHLPLYLELEK